ncbi:hypothetical protein N3K66_000197 [Trichothecium roseum]|uniref:Uncharacterized protein n=1 Tax=Trichothecium roseum TaxID=47278 RepID=A0ACC0VDX6_9HYPO|nr:hypothetical protein N3K66_000197 [Trichothecium roseum]
MKVFAIVAASFAALASAAPAPAQQCTPATYACTRHDSGWKVCNTSGNWEFAGSCPPKTVCKFFEPSLSPYCVPPEFTIPN